MCAIVTPPPPPQARQAARRLRRFGAKTASRNIWRQASAVQAPKKKIIIINKKPQRASQTGAVQCSVRVCLLRQKSNLTEIILIPLKSVPLRMWSALRALRFSCALRLRSCQRVLRHPQKEAKKCNMDDALLRRPDTTVPPPVTPPNGAFWKRSKLGCRKRKHYLLFSPQSSKVARPLFGFSFLPK